jgi:hypothetical protein
MLCNSKLQFTDRGPGPGAGLLAASLLAVVLVLGGCRESKPGAPTNTDRPGSGGKTGSGGKPVDPGDGTGGTAAGGSMGGPDATAPDVFGVGGTSGTDAGNPVEISCGAAMKECNGMCIAEDAPCGDTCPTGKNLCKGVCVDGTSTTACGTACTVCPTSANGTASCDGDKCDLTCAAGYHKCGDACLPDGDADSCGTSCSPCMKPTAGTATCVDGPGGTKMCGASCPDGTKLCGDACIGVNAPCMGTCADGKHACNGLCVPNTDVNSCGTTSCTTCPVPANGSASCDGTTCGITCKTGFHKCGDGPQAECKANTSVGSCGTLSCTACPTPANGAPSCDGTACGIKCNTGFHKCGTGPQTECKANNSELSCGTLCTPCATVMNGRPTCAAGKCDAICNPGFHKCNALCIPDAQACGTTCGPTFKFCGAGKCVPTSTLTAEVCDKKDNDCNGVVDDVTPIDCSNACARNAKKVCDKNTGKLDESACKPGPSPNNGDACGPVGGNKCEICAQGSTCMGGNCIVVNCPQGQRPCAAQNKCLPNEMLCGNACPNNFQVCGNKCIPNGECCKATNPRCCVDQVKHSDCGRCEKCINKVCVAQLPGEDFKGECTGTPQDCNSGSCNGAGACGFKPANTLCGGATPTCNAANGFIIDAPKCSGDNATCAAPTGRQCPAQGQVPAFCANGSCQPKKLPGEPCDKPYECRGNICNTAKKCCTGSNCGL